MENVTDALHMAFGVLAFVVALSVSIVAFGQVRSASQAIIDSNDRETTYTYVEYTNNNSTRKVTAEDLIPTLYRAYKENYLVRFEGIGDLYEVRVIKKENGVSISSYEPTSIIDLEKQSIGNQSDANKFIEALLNGKAGFDKLDKVRFSYFGEYLQNKPFYDILKENTFEEKLGVFYQEDRVEDATTNTTPINNGVDDINKTEKRIITYIKQ